MSLLTPTMLNLTLLHLGTLHAHERLLVLLVAFGPLVVLVAVVFVLRRRDIAAEAREAQDTSAQGASAQDQPPPAYDRRETS